MASVLHLSQLQPTHANHLFPDREQLSLSLDLSLGGLFAKQNSNLHLTVESLKASQSSNSPVEKLKAGSTSPLGINNHNTGLAPARIDFNPFSNASHEPAVLLRTRSVQAQRRHEARKRRKSIIEGKLHKRAKGDSQTREELPTSNAHYLEILTPSCDEGKENVLNDADKLNYKEFMSKEDVLVSAYPEGILSWTGESNDVSTGRMCSMPAPMVDYMNVLGSEKDVQNGTKSSAPSEMSYDMPMEGNVSYVGESSNCLQHVVPSEFMCKPDVTSDVKQGLNGDVSSVRQAVLSCASSGNSILTSRATYASGQKEQPHAQSATGKRGGNAYCHDATIPTRGSSSGLLSGHAGETRDSTHNLMVGNGYNSERMDRSCISSSSEVENDNATGDESMQINSRRCKEEAAQVEQAHPSVMMPAGISVAYPHPFPVMPLPYPYGVPLPWGLSLPWFTPGSGQNAFGVPIGSPPSKEAFAIPFGGIPTPYHLPVHGSSHWLPFIPTSGLGTSTSSESSIPMRSSGEMSKNLQPSHKGEETSELGQDTNTSGDLVSVHETQTASMEADREGNVVSQVQAEHAMMDGPSREKTEGGGCLLGDGKSSALMQSDKLSDKEDSPTVVSSRLCKGGDMRVRQAPSENPAAAGRQQSVHLAKDPASKKKKVVRFNSLDQVAGPYASREGNGACQSVDSKADSISSSQQCAGAASSSTQTDLEPSNCTRCGDARQNFNHIEECISSNKNFKRGVEDLADDVMHADSLTPDGEMGHENIAGDSSAIVQPCKRDIKDKIESQSLTSLPRVITRGSGAHGKTIHGVMYITKEKQARLICLCHGKHMSPVEFVRHSGSSDLSNPERSIVLESFTYGDPDISVPA